MYWWVFPGLLVLAAILGVFYLVVRFTGGSGVRTEGRTIHDKPQPDDDPPPR